MSGETEETVERTVTTKKVKQLVEASEATGHDIGGHMKRDGDTFEDEELGDAWNESVDATKELMDKVFEDEKTDA